MVTSVVYCRLMAVAGDHTLLPVVPCTRVLLLAQLSEEKQVSDILSRVDIIMVMGLLPYFSETTCASMADEVVGSLIQMCHNSFYTQGTYTTSLYSMLSMTFLSCIIMTLCDYLCFYFLL